MRKILGVRLLFCKGENIGGFRLLNIRRKSYHRISRSAVVSGRDVENRIGY